MIENLLLNLNSIYYLLLNPLCAFVTANGCFVILGVIASTIKELIMLFHKEDTMISRGA